MQQTSIITLQLITCCCLSSVGLESFVKVNIIVKDINDNKPELTVDEIFVCENDLTNMVRKRRYLQQVFT